jgi:hypothetical protein
MSKNLTIKISLDKYWMTFNMIIDIPNCFFYSINIYHLEPLAELESASPDYKSGTSPYMFKRQLIGLNVIQVVTLFHHSNQLQF